MSTELKLFEIGAVRIENDRPFSYLSNVEKIYLATEFYDLLSHGNGVEVVILLGNDQGSGQGPVLRSVDLAALVVESAIDIH